MMNQFTSSPPGQNGRHLDRRQFKMHFLDWKLWNSDSNLVEICHQNSIGNKPALVHVMAWRGTRDTLLPEPMLILFTDAYMRHYEEMG